MKMFRIVSLCVVALSMTVGMKAQSGNSAADEDAVRAVALQETDGWSKFDPGQIAGCYTVGTTWQNPFGVRIHSRADLQKFLAKLFQRPG
jgi:nuclear transport factor 2 (NTF2) superfamily protein